MSDATQLEVLENILKKRHHQSAGTKDSMTKGGGDRSSQVSSNTSGVTVAASTEASSSIHNDLLTPSAYLPSTRNASSEAFIDDDVLRGTLESGHYCVSIANQDVTELPIGLGMDRVCNSSSSPSSQSLHPSIHACIHPSYRTVGDTLNLQLCYTKAIICTRNKLRNLLSSKYNMMSLHHLRYVTQLNLSFNDLSYMPYDFGVMRLIEHLDLSYNNLSSLPQSIVSLQRLKSFNLQHNSFVKLPDTFTSLNELQVLNLAENIFTTFPYQVIKLRCIDEMR